MKLNQLLKIKILRKLDKIDIDQEHLFFALTLIVGVGAGALAVFINKATHYLTNLFATNAQPTWQSYGIAVSLIFISGYLTTRKFPSAAGSGIPGTKIALVVYHGQIKFRDWIAKLIVSIMSLSSGVALGREGPTISVTSGLGSSLGNLFALPKVKIKSLVAVGAAGGMAAAFNTPIAAVTFTLEEIVGNFNSKSLGPIIIASVIAAITAQMFYGYNTTFDIQKYKFTDPTELIFYLSVGVAAALLAPYWVKLILYLRQQHNKIFRGHRLTFMLFTITLLFAVAIYFPLVLGSGHHVVNEMLHSNITNIKTIATLLALKFFFSALCYSAGISGGLFMPTLFMGAMVGSLIGIGAEYLYPSISEIGAYALVGMGAFFATVMRAPITSIMIIFEMTHDYRIVLPLMVANISAYLLSQKLSNGSIYEQLSEQDGIHLPTREDFEILEELTVEEAMIRDVKTLNFNLTVREALKQVNHSEVSGYPVMKHGNIFGVISTNEIGQAFAKFKGECLLSDVCTKKIIHIYPDQSLMMAFHYLNRYKISRLLVVSRVNDKKLVGIITAEDIVCRFGYHIQEESKYNVIDEYLQQIEKDKPEEVYPEKSTNR